MTQYAATLPFKPARHSSEPNEPLTNRRIVMFLIMVAVVAMLLIAPLAIMSQHAGVPDDCGKRAAALVETTGQPVATSCK